jgi:outer membrane protein assembly factor BamB
VSLGPDGTAYVTAFDGTLYAGGTVDGARYATKLGGRVRGSVLVGAGGVVYAGATDGRLDAIGPEGVVRWSAALGSECQSSPVVGRSARSSSGPRAAGDGRAADGREDGHVDLRANLRSAPVVDADGFVYVGDHAGFVHAVGPSGTLVGSLETRAEIDASPALGADGRLYIASSDAALHAVR